LLNIEFGNKRPSFALRGAKRKEKSFMGRYMLLWLLGGPIPILLLIWLFGGLH
jgi:hypothetical protein